MRLLHSCRAVAFAMAVTSTALLTACGQDGPPTAAAIASPTESATARTVAPPTATITFETRVAGYSQSGDNGWITVSSTCGGGGRVVRGGRADACTDRVSRGEQLRVRISARGAHRTEAIGIAGVTSSNGFARGAFINVPFSATFTVSPDPSFDNVQVAVLLFDSNLRPLADIQQRRVPIGRRP
jgi:hypothetical protein